MKLIFCTTFWILLLTSLNCSVAHGQSYEFRFGEYEKEKNSFFLNKRFTIEGNIVSQFSPHPQARFRNKIFESNEFLHMHVYGGLTGSFALSNKLGIYVSAEKNEYLVSRYSAFDIINALSNYSDIGINTSRVGVGFSFYNAASGALAPMGGQFRFGLSKVKNQMTITNTRNDVVTVYPKEIDFTAIHFGFYRSYPVTKTIYYTIGLTTNINIGIKSEYDSDRSPEENTFRSSLKFQNALGGSFGIGIMPF